MKKLLLILTITVIIPGLSYSQATWIEQPVTPQPIGLFSVNAFSANYAWTCGDNGQVLYTANGGTNWSYRNPPQAQGVYTVYGVNALDPVTCVCLVNTNDTALVLRTNNAGNSWFTVFSKTGIYLDDIKFINNLTGFAYGDPTTTTWWFMKTTNGGNSWDTTITRPPSVTNEFGLRNAMFLLYNGNVVKIWFGTDAGIMHYSINSGASWQISGTPGNSFIHGITFVNDNLGFCDGQGCFISSNGGGSWVFQSNYPIFGNCYSFANNGGYLWYTTGSRICYSTDMGGSFNVQHLSPDNSVYEHLSFTQNLTDDNLTTIYGWGISDNGIISKYTQPNIGIHQISTEIPNGYRLEQNYPNPFNPSTKIRFSLPKAGYISLNTYDILGRLVKSIYSGSLKPGNYETDFDASELSSGMYFYKLESEKFTDVKKMIVVK